MNPTRPMSEDHMRTGPEVICEAVEDIILLHGVPTVEIRNHLHAEILRFAVDGSARDDMTAIAVKHLRD